MARQRKNIDWEGMEPHYRANMKSLRILGEEFGCTEGAIRKEAKKRGWTRDYTARIKAKREDLVRKEEVRRLVRSEMPSEKEVIEIAAENQKDVILAHRQVINRVRAVALALLDRLSALNQYEFDLQDLGEMLRNPDERNKDRLNDIYRRVIELPEQVDAIKKLAETIKLLISLEREAFGIEGKGAVDDITEAATNITVSFITAPPRQLIHQQTY